MRAQSARAVAGACCGDERRQAGVRPLRVDGRHEASYHGADAVVAAAACVDTVLHGVKEQSDQARALHAVLIILHMWETHSLAVHQGIYAHNASRPYRIQRPTQPHVSPPSPKFLQQQCLGSTKGHAQRLQILPEALHPVLSLPQGTPAARCTSACWWPGRAGPRTRPRRRPAPRTAPSRWRCSRSR